MFEGLEGLVIFLDDIVCFGRNLEEHNRRLHAILRKVRESGLKLNKEKCVFIADKVEFCGHTVSGYGIFKINRDDSIINFPTLPTRF